MKQFKKFAAILMTVCFLLQSLTVFAMDEAADSQSAARSATVITPNYYFNDFDTDMAGLTIINANGETLTTTVADDGTTVLRVPRTQTSPLNGGAIFGLTTPIVPKVAKAKVVFEFRYRVNKPFGPGARMQDDNLRDKNSSTVAIYQDNIYTRTTEAPADKIATALRNVWHTVTIVYDSESNERIIKVDTNDPFIDKTAGTNNYYKTGKFSFSFYGYLRGGSEIDYDYFKIYEAPVEFSADVYNTKSSELDQITLDFNSEPDMTTMAAEDFQIEDNTITNITPDPGNNLRYYLDLEKSLEPDTDYELSVNGIKNIYGSSMTKTLSFTTRGLIQYAKSIEISEKGEGNYTVTSQFVNEKEAFQPVLNAALYRADGSLRKLETQENSVGFISKDESEANEVTNQITIPDGAEETDRLELYYVKNAAVCEPISGKTVYTKDSKTEANSTPVVSAYTGTCAVEITPDPETEEITVQTNTGEKDAEREIHINVYSVPEKEEVEEELVYAGMEKTEAGKAIFQYKMADADGKYRVSAFVRGAAQPVPDKEYTFYSKGILDVEFGKANETTDPFVMEDFILFYGEACNLNMIVFRSLSDAGKQHVYSSLIALRNEKNGQVFQNTLELNESLQIAGTLARILEGNDIASLLTESKVQLGLSETASLLFEKTLSKGAVKTVASNIAGKAYLVPSKVSEAFTQRVVLDGNWKAENYQQTRTILEKMKDEIGIDFTACNKLKYPEKVSMALTGKSYQSFSALKTAFDDAVSKQAKDEQKGNNSSTGSSGGSSGGGYRPPDISFEQTPAPTPTAKPEKKFTDMDGYEWAGAAVSTLVKKEIISGKTEDQFAPGDDITRAEFVKLIVSAFRLPDKSNENPFTDIHEDDWYCRAVLNAYHNGIISGMEEKQFRPDEKLTREMAAAIIYRAFQAIDATLVNEKNDFTDSDSINPYAQEAVKHLCGHGIINGFEDGTFRPGNVCNRAEAAQMIYTSLTMFE